MKYLDFCQKKWYNLKCIIILFYEVKNGCKFKKLWKLLIDKDMMKKDLRVLTGLSSSTIAKMTKNETVSTDVLVKICAVLNCDVGDIMEVIPTSEETK